LKEDPPIPPQRKYDKGERRRKHVGRGEQAELSVHQDSPRRVVGKCPANISEGERETLLNRAVPSPNGDRDLSPPKKVYAVHKGVVYEAQTSDRGRTYHGYPYRGKLSDALTDLLRGMARDEGCLAEFERWRKANIVRHGR
jgi:hypothetical protein